MEPATSIAKTQIRQKVADELIHVLADTYVLYLKTQNFHWNIKGPLFAALHGLFEKQYEELAAATDVIAERIRALDCFVPASFTEFLKLTSIKENTSEISAEQMIKILMKDHETISHQLLLVFAKAEKANDQATIDLLTERMRAHEKTAWMLKSSL